MKEAAQKAYNASSIVVLEGLDAVKKRPGMYIGDVNSSEGLHHMLWEIVDNAVDEALAGHAKKVLVTLYPDGSASVEDDGRGMPVDMHPTEKRSAAEVIMTVLHAGGKFDQNSYKVSGGLHGVGASVVNALSASLSLTIWRDGHEHLVEFSRGITQAPLKRIGKCAKDKTGTKVRFLPDHEMFTVTEFDRDVITRRMRDISFLNSGIRLELRDERHQPALEDVFYAEGGVAEMVKHLDRSREAIIPEPIHLKGIKDNIEVEIALEWTDSYHETMLAFTNNIPQGDHGTHVAGFRAAMTRVVQAYIKQEGIKKGEALEPDDIREGMTAVVSIKMPDPKFSAQTKDKLVSSEAMPAVQTVMSEGLQTWFEEHPVEARRLIEKAASAAAARIAARKARDLSRENKGADIASLPGKLADCQSKKPEECELFLVEGDSAGGSAKQGRERKFQAILPLRGKILNVERARLDKVLSSQEVGTLIKALGTGIGQNFDADKCRYHKIIIMTDADVDGAHIRTLLLTFFFRQMPELVKRGYVWIAQPPLYKLKSGRKERFLPDGDALEREIAQSGIDGITGGLSGPALADALLQLRGAFKPIETLGSRLGSIDLADALIASGTLAAAVAGKPFQRKAEAAARLLNQGLDARRDGKWSIHVQDDAVVAAFEHEGVVETRRILQADLQNADGRAIARLQSKIDALLAAGPYERAGERLRIVGPYSLWRLVEERGRKGIEIQRFKGLGEMNPDELWETTLDSKVRRLLRVEITDSEHADELFSVLMGDAVEARRAYIEERGLEAELDF